MGSTACLGGWLTDSNSTSAKQAFCISRDAVHCFDNNDSQDVKALCVITPAAKSPRFFREAAEVINAVAGGPPDVAKMAAIMRAHGFTPAAPHPEI